MFAPSIGRAVRSASCFSALPANSLRQAAFNSAQTPFRQWHQRRLSSSKPSVPPENKKKPNQKVERTEAAQASSEKKVEKKSESKKPKAQPTSSRNNVPRVPSTSHLSIQDVNSALSRASDQPLPIHNGHKLPEVDKETFEKLMRGEVQLDHIVHQAQELQEMQVVLEVLENAVETMQARIAKAKAEPGIAPTERSIHAYVEKMPPFVPPPPPVAFDPFISAPASLKGLELRNSEPEFYTEVQLPLEQQVDHEQPATFRDHVRQRRGGMLLISVKRQRKLKMKKHKYKKLMKRTRLLRRKLDRT